MATSASTVAASSAGLPAGVAVGPLGPRFLASLVDVAVPAATIGLPIALDASRTRILVGLVIAVVWGLVVWAMFALRAAGPGMRLTKLQLVGLSDGRPIGFARFAVRALVLAALTVTGLGLLLMLAFLLRHRRHQGWHDLIADSVVIRERALAPPLKRKTAAATGPAAPKGSGVATETDHAPVLASDTAGVVVESREREGRAAVTTVNGDAEGSGPAGDWVAVLDDGRQIPVESVVLLGRNPTPLPGEETAALVQIADDTRTVSKSHLALGREGQGIYVRDLGSTNGSTVTDFSGVSRPCPPDDAVWVTEGTIVSFGDHWLEIRRAGASVGSPHAPVRP